MDFKKGCPKEGRKDRRRLEDWFAEGSMRWDKGGKNKTRS
jgi:hypothetical protein